MLRTLLMATQIKGCESIVADGEFLTCYTMSVSFVFVDLLYWDSLGCSVGCRMATRSFYTAVVSHLF